MNINDITITSLETINAFDIVTGNYLFTLDELQNATIAQTQDSQDITGKGGRKLATLKRNKAVTISGTNGLISGGLLEMQTGSKFTKSVGKVMWTDYLTVGIEHTATLKYPARGTEGAEIEALYVLNSDGTLGDELTQDAQAAAGKFAYNPTTKVLTFHTDIAAGTEIVVYYMRHIVDVPVLENLSDTYSEKCTLYVNALAEDKCANVYHVQFFIPKADFNGEFSIEMGENQAVHAFEASSLSGACGTAGQFWTFTIVGANDRDLT